MTTQTATKIVTTSTTAQLAARYGLRFLQALCNALASAMGTAQRETDYAQAEENTVVEAWNRGDYRVALSRDYQPFVADALRAANHRLDRAHKAEEAVTAAYGAAVDALLAKRLQLRLAREAAAMAAPMLLAA